MLTVIVRVEPVSPHNLTLAVTEQIAKPGTKAHTTHITTSGGGGGRGREAEGEAEPMPVSPETEARVVEPSSPSTDLNSGPRSPWPITSRYHCFLLNAPPPGSPSTLRMLLTRG